LCADEKLPQRFTLVGKRGDQSALLLAIGQLGSCFFCRFKFDFCLRRFLIGKCTPLGQRGRGLLQSGECVFCPVGFAQRLAQRILVCGLLAGKAASLILRESDALTQIVKRGRLFCHLCLGGGYRIEQCRQAVCAFKLFSRRRAIVLGDEPIPTAQLAIASDEPLADVEHRAIVGFDHTHHCEAESKLARRFDHIRKPLA